MASVDPPAPAASAEEAAAAAKRNTDCVYFLASPLTCKKGSDCEFRHSEVALMNPRDCWYWLNGNCLNPRCGFRHPPLDVFYGASGVVPTVSKSHQMPKAADTFVSGYNVKKQDVPCHFFQMNRCVKGDMCPYLHDPQIAFQGGNPPQQSKLAAADEPETRVNEYLQNCHNKQYSSETHILNHSDQLVPVERSVKEEAASHQEKYRKKSVFGTYSFVDGSSEPEASDSSLAKEKSGDRRSSHPEDDFRNSKDEDGCLGDSSPGFDVLVDNNDDDSDYFYNEDARVNGVLPESSLSLFDHSGLFDTDRLAIYGRDLDNAADYDQYMFCYNPYGYESYDHGYHGYHAFSERINDGLLGDKKGTLSRKNPEKISSSDLRHLLPQKRRRNGHRTNPDRSRNYFCNDEYLPEERRDRSHSNRDLKFPSTRSFSSRLQGRLKLPDKSDLENADYTRGFEESEGQRRLGRSSSNGKRHRRERKRQVQDLGGDGRHSRSSTRDFRRNTSGLSTKHENSGVQRRVDSSVSFEGPKSLSILLKRKREAASVNNGRLRSEHGSPRPKQAFSADEKISSENAKLEVSSMERKRRIHEVNLSDHKKDEDASSLRKKMLVAAVKEDDQEYGAYGGGGDEDCEYDLSEEG